jgi:hypothetical protein
MTAKRASWRRAKMLFMKHLIAFVVMLAIGLQGSLVASAAIAPLMSPDCQTSATGRAVSSDSCCPSGLHSMNCCLDECLATAAVTVAYASPVRYYGPDAQASQFFTTTFSSRGDSPLIRPPIL